MLIANTQLHCTRIPLSIQVVQEPQQHLGGGMPPRPLLLLVQEKTVRGKAIIALQCGRLGCFLRSLSVMNLPRSPLLWSAIDAC